MEVWKATGMDMSRVRSPGRAASGFRVLKTPLGPWEDFLF